MIASTKDDVIDFLTNLGKQEGESYATRFIRERTSILIRKDEEDLVELPSSYTYRKIYERLVFFLLRLLQYNFLF